MALYHNDRYRGPEIELYDLPGRSNAPLRVYQDRDNPVFFIDRIVPRGCDWRWSLLSPARILECFLRVIFGRLWPAEVVARDMVFDGSRGYLQLCTFIMVIVFNDKVYSTCIAYLK